MAVISRAVALLRFRAWQCVRSWRTTSCAAGISGALVLYLTGEIRSEPALVTIGALTALGQLFSADANRVP